MTMSTMTVGLDHPSHMLIVPAAGFPEIISPFSREEERLRSLGATGRLLIRQAARAASPPASAPCGRCSSRDPGARGRG
jgi:hypothetical protein